LDGDLLRFIYHDVEYWLDDKRHDHPRDLERLESKSFDEFSMSNPPNANTCCHAKVRMNYMN